MESQLLKPSFDGNVAFSPAAMRMVFPQILWFHLFLTATILGASGNPLVAKGSSKDSLNQVSSGKRHLCGPDLREELHNVCLVYHSWFPQVTTSSAIALNDLQRRQDRATDGVAHECCVNGCSRTYLEGFCAVVRNQTSEETRMESTVTSSQPEKLQTVLVTPTTDPPNKPEFVYAGESWWDQEPLTLVQTYTSPEYSANRLNF